LKRLTEKLREVVPIGEGRLLDTLLETVDTVRPRLLKRTLEWLETWTPGEMLFGEKKRRGR